ncbi:TlpA disulfide reductase family protein [Pelomonas sp. SE-A7]|uniref:TlpA disulfide reductase family protein n=1 Tax=Pelomonas sp. SE-A7 TaxID=3054953 RepID=UPI00259D2D90|nr:TlpA disulfide reductase family protein [Pelomonas sp. SE-A7]MDM4767975.1 TlpA disulfide reductase family protein [Pelomonas sp. SE-A7]
MKLPRLLAPLLIVVALVIAGALAYRSLVQKQRAPQVDYVLVDGSRLNSAQWGGKVMLVNFWATSCTTCVHEMPQIIATHQKFKGRGFDTVAVAMSYDPPAYVASFAESRQLPFSVAIDSTGVVAQSFGKVQLTPTTFLVNKRGEIVKKYVGEPDFNALHALVEQLLAES